MVPNDIRRFTDERAAPARRPAKASKAPPVPAPEQDEVRVLDFALDEVREARLVPVIDFKKRRAPPAGDADRQDGGAKR